MKTNLRYLSYYFIWLIILSITVMFLGKEYTDGKKSHTELYQRISSIELILKMER